MRLDVGSAVAPPSRLFSPGPRAPSRSCCGTGLSEPDRPYSGVVLSDNDHTPRSPWARTFPLPARAIDTIVLLDFVSAGECFCFGRPEVELNCSGGRSARWQLFVLQLRARHWCGSPCSVDQNVNPPSSPPLPAQVHVVARHPLSLTAATTHLGLGWRSPWRCATDYLVINDQLWRYHCWRASLSYTPSWSSS